MQYLTFPYFCYFTNQIHKANYVKHKVYIKHKMSNRLQFTTISFKDIFLKQITTSSHSKSNSNILNQKPEHIPS